ncbi:hypothetical protein [Marinobacter nauticus]|uniref:Uncharacterized protein n=1 Tax=Marinobacter nauticus TaxID=2743 RepID=A0A833NDX8_MARNT|nr:hypothetical protein [Marinobacter nauticus]KAE8546114.1 hypothetical protein F6453_1360 [Marinobacter nauticus]
MNRSKFERFARKNGLPLERLSNDKRYTSLETEWAWRGYCEATESLVSEAVAICREEADEWDSDRLVTHKNYAEHCGERIRQLKEDNRVCAICDGGPGNDCSCSCGMQKWEG